MKKPFISNFYLWLKEKMYPQMRCAEINITLKTKIDYANIQSVSIYNNSGTLMQRIQSEYEYIDISLLTSGVYNMQIITDEGLATQRFVKID